MIKTIEFKEWLKNNTTFSDNVIKDTVSRMKRADYLLEWKDEEIYQFHLEHIDDYMNLSVSVRSQIKRAIKLYTEFQRQQNNDQAKDDQP